MKRQFDAGVDVDVAAESGGDAHVVASLLVHVPYIRSPNFVKLSSFFSLFKRAQHIFGLCLFLKHSICETHGLQSFLVGTYRDY
jgi:hypothetical protein